MKLENFDFSKKIFYHPDKIQDFKDGKRPFPVTVEIDLTNNCNHKCHLFLHLVRQNTTLETKVIKKTISEMKEKKFYRRRRPMLHPDFRNC